MFCRARDDGLIVSLLYCFCVGFNFSFNILQRRDDGLMVSLLYCFCVGLNFSFNVLESKGRWCDGQFDGSMVCMGKGCWFDGQSIVCLWA